MSNPYTDFITEQRRLKILVLLREANAYILDEVLLNRLLTRSGLPVSRADLRCDLRCLRDLDCILLDTSDGVWTSTLTRTGSDCAQGLVECRGVARPEPV